MNPEQTFLYAQKLIADKQAKKPVMEENNTPEATARMIVAEAQELVAAVDEAMVTDEVWTIASELADVLYLTLYLCEKCGLDAFEVLEMKIDRNEKKYPADRLQAGEYSEIIKQLKSEWKEKGGDQKWSHDILTTPY